MTDFYEASDKIKSVKNRQLGASIFETTLYISGLTNISGTSYWYGSVEFDLAQLNLNTLVPEFEITMYTFIKVSGPEPGTFIYYNEHQKLPFTNPLISGSTSDIGLIEEHARGYIYYESAGGVKQDVTTGTSKLVIYYLARGGGLELRSRRFDVKIKGSDAITA